MKKLDLLTRCARIAFLVCAAAVIGALAAPGCGLKDPLSSLSDTGTGAGYTNLGSLGNFAMNCPDTAKQAQQQAQFQTKQEESCSQHFEFQQQKVGDFDVDLDCTQAKVSVKNKGSSQQEQAQQDMPIQDDGSVQGKMQFAQQMQNDGKGNEVCWVETVVIFDGKASCPGLNAPENSKQSLSMDTQIEPQATTQEALSKAGMIEASPSPSPAPSSASPTTMLEPTDSPIPYPAPNPSMSTYPSPMPSPHPSPMPSTSPSPSPSMSPSPSSSPSPSHRPSPTPRTTSVVVCAVQNPCPISAKTDMSCE